MPVNNTTNAAAFKGSFTASINNNNIDVTGLPSGVRLIGGNNTPTVKLGVGNGVIELARRTSVSNPDGIFNVIDNVSGLIHITEVGNSFTLIGGSGPVLLSQGDNTFLEYKSAPFSGSFRATAKNGNMSVNPSSLPKGVTLVNGSNNTPTVELKVGSGTIYLENVSGKMVAYDEGVPGFINVGPSGNSLIIGSGYGGGINAEVINGQNGQASFSGINISANASRNSGVSPITVNQNGAFGPGWIPQGGVPGSSNITSYKNAFGLSGVTINEFQEPSGPVFNMAGAPSGVYASITAGPSGQYSFKEITGALPSGKNILTPSKNSVYFNYTNSLSSGPLGGAAFSGSFKVSDTSGIINVSSATLPAGVTIVNGTNNSSAVTLQVGGGTIQLSSTASGMTVTDKGVSGAFNMIGPSGNTLTIAGGSGPYMLFGGSGFLSFTMSGIGNSSAFSLPAFALNGDTGIDAINKRGYDGNATADMIGPSGAINSSEVIIALNDFIAPSGLMNMDKNKPVQLQTDKTQFNDLIGVLAMVDPTDAKTFTPFSGAGVDPQAASGFYSVFPS